MKQFSASIVATTSSTALFLLLCVLSPAVLAQTFGPAIGYSAAISSGPRGLAVGDVNGDGRPDIVMGNSGFPDVRVWLGQGGGTFGAVSAYPTNIISACLAVVDFNGDGRADVVTAGHNYSNNTNTVSILRGQAGTAGLMAAVPITIGASYPQGIAVADVDQDGDLDIVTANYNNVNSTNDVILILAHQGSLYPGSPIVTGRNSFEVGVAVGDVSGDGRADILVTNSGARNVAMLQAQGGGSFAAPQLYVPGGTPYDVAVGDVNGDGRNDLVACLSNAVGVMLGAPGGGLQAAVTYAAGGGPTSVALGDVNGDGRKDIVTGNESAGSVGVLLALAGGGFAPVATYSAGGTPYKMVLADVNADGRPDAITANFGSAAVLLNRSPALAAAVGTPTDGVVCYPNPAHGAFTVLLPANAGPARAELLNTLGQVVRRQEGPLTAGSFRVETDGLPAGIYTLRLQPLGVARRLVLE
ncbi:hypothetical protein GCM10022409_28970 [Hymenobacter glaciei]|uniref:Secretion system C-terminal sorting domain-containing protein n=1 Tax=Hymenobacter glaciei TaxID=877209 RepID=A0ABP7UE39_9BACT